MKQRISPTPLTPEERIRELEAHLERLQHRLKRAASRRHRILTSAGRLGVRLYAGPSLYRSLQRGWDAWAAWLSAGKKGAWPQEETRDVVAAIASRATRVVTFGVLIAALPLLVLLIQTLLLSKQTQLLQAQNVRISQQNELLDTQNRVLQRQLLTSTDPSLRVEPFGWVSGSSNEVFNISLKNTGLSGLSDIKVYSNYYLGNRGPILDSRSVPLTLSATVVSTLPVEAVGSLSPGEVHLVKLMVRDRFENNFEEELGDKYKVIRLRIDHRRDIDDREFTMVKGYVWFDRINTLIDIESEGQSAMPDFQRLKAVLSH